MSRLLQQGLRAHQQGDLASANAYYQKQLTQDPNNIDALQLMGSLYAAQHDYVTSIAYMKKALSIDNKQSKIWLNLAICYKKNRQLDDALHSCLHVVELDRGCQQAYDLVIGLYLDKGQSEIALRWCDKAMKAFNLPAKYLRRKASVLSSLGDYDKSLALFDEALQHDPDKAGAIHDKAVVLRLSGQSNQALDLYLQLQRSGLATFQLYHNMGNAYSDLGKLEQAISCYRQAIELNPVYCESHVNLSELLFESGQSANFLDTFQLAIVNHPHELKLRLAYCQALLRTKNYQICIDTLDPVPAEQQNSAEYYDALGRAHKGLGNTSQSLACYKQAMLCSDLNKQIQLSYAGLLIEVDSINEAQQLLQKIVQDYPEDQFGWAMLGICWRLNGNEQEKYLNNYDELVMEYHIDVPEGFNSVEEFCRQLNQYLSTLHTGSQQPLEQTLTGGTQTRGNLFNDPHPLIKKLISQLKPCIEDYISRTKPHEFLPQATGQGYEFSGSWSVKLNAQGHHTPHVHPMGWISSAFYVALPNEMDQTQAQRQGWFCLGKPNIATKHNLATVREFKPVIGKLILFRSYMWHSTNPFEAKTPRTTVAFDVIPASLE